MASSAVGLALFVVFVSGSLALPVKESDVAYYIYNNISCNDRLETSTFDLIDVSMPINYVIRGCPGSEGNDSWIDDLIDAYVGRDVNVIVADWRGGQEEEHCPESVQEVQRIGNDVGNVIKTVYDRCGGNLSDVHIIGHSVGAHIAAFAGQRVKQLTEMSVGRITALDPALPVFLLVGDDNRLSRDDAEVVVAVHTDGGFSGFKERVGSVDVYPNGGVAPQPGCPQRISACSHEKATEYFVQAISDPSAFVAKQCASYYEYDMGLCDQARSLAIGADITPDDEGVYYLRTSPEVYTRQ